MHNHGFSALKNQDGAHEKEYFPILRLTLPYVCSIVKCEMGRIPYVCCMQAATLWGGGQLQKEEGLLGGAGNSTGKCG